MITRRFACFAFLILSVLILNQALAENTITGKVVSIADGDTVTVLDSSNTQHKTRIYGVDCPESHQDFGQKAKQFTSDMVFGKMVEVRVMDTDRYGRTVGIVNIGGKCLNEELLKAGFAWFYPQYCKAPVCSQWKQYQETARSMKIGLWAQANSIPPWDFRRGVKTVSGAETTPQGNQQIGGYHGNTSSRIFHQSGCKVYDCKNCTAVFQNRDQAIGSGYRPCGMCKP